MDDVLLKGKAHWQEGANKTCLWPTKKSKSPQKDNDLLVRGRL